MSQHNNIVYLASYARSYSDNSDRPVNMNLSDSEDTAIENIVNFPFHCRHDSDYC